MNFVSNNYANIPYVMEINDIQTTSEIGFAYNIVCKKDI